MKRAMYFLALILAACQSRPPAPSAAPPQDGLLEGVAEGKTQILDLTHALTPRSPYWPGRGYNPFRYEIFSTIEKDGVRSGRFSMAEHTGTHLDAPNHFVAGQVSVDKIPLQHLFAHAVVINVRPQVAQNPDYALTREDVLAWEREHGKVPQNAVVFLYTGWDENWEDYENYKNMDANGVFHFPGYSPASAEYLVNERNVAGLGIDTLSVDYGPSKNFRVHHISNSKGKYHLENVANLGTLPAVGAFVIVAPIKIENGTGGPTRIFALVRSNSP